jgi:hypothetical protein
MDETIYRPELLVKVADLSTCPMIGNCTISNRTINGEIQF